MLEIHNIVVSIIGTLKRDLRNIPKFYFSYNSLKFTINPCGNVSVRGGKSIWGITAKCFSIFPQLFEFPHTLKDLEWLNSKIPMDVIRHHLAPMLLANMRIRNISFRAHVGIPIELNQFYKRVFSKMSETCFSSIIEYSKVNAKQFKFSGTIIKTKTATLIAFRSGQIIVTGCRDVNEANSLYERLKPDLLASRREIYCDISFCLDNVLDQDGNFTTGYIDPATRVYERHIT